MAAFTTPVLPGLSLVRSGVAGKHQPVNSYIWQGPDGVVVIDPAEDLDAVGAAGFLVTHVQREHIAGAAHASETPLYIPAGDEYLCQGDAAYENIVQPWEAPWDWDERGNFQGHLAGALNERPPSGPLAITRVLRDGDEILGLRALGTPGHGKNALTYLAEIDDKKVAFCGDLIFGNGQLWNWFDADWDYGLQLGHSALITSAQRLLAERPDILLPAHGEPVLNASASLQLLIDRLQSVLPPDPVGIQPLNFPDNENPLPGWRQLSPHLYQWKDGNCALLVSRKGVGLLVDDGLCHWLPLEERAPHHRAVMSAIKEKLNISRIEAVLVTHYHGDHIYNIPTLVEDEGAEIITLDTVADVMENEKRFNLSSPLWWYGDVNERVPVHRRLSDGDTLHWREYHLEVFHLGGQTYYHAGIAAKIDENRVCFVGDAVYGWSTQPEPIPCYNDANPETRGWLHAVNKLIDRQPGMLVCGHGSALKDPMPLLEAKRTSWQEQLGRFIELSAQSSLRDFFDPFAEVDGQRA